MVPEDDPFDFEEHPPQGDDVERPEPGEPDAELMARVLDALKTVQDPEIPVNLVDLGLIYELIVNGRHCLRRDDADHARLSRGEALPGQVKDAIAAVAGVNDARVKLVWTPPWSRERMSEEAKLELGLM